MLKYLNFKKWEVIFIWKKFFSFAKDVIKNNLKDKALGRGNDNNNSNIIKDMAKAKILAIVAPFLGWLILIVIILIIMLAPLSYAHMLMMETFKDIQHGVLKAGTNFSIAMSDWFKSDDEAIKDSGEKYENYLTKRFMQLNKQMYNRTLMM